MKTDFEGTLGKSPRLATTKWSSPDISTRRRKIFARMLDKYKLTSPSEHVSYEVVQNKWQETLDAAHVVGHKFIVCPAIDDEQRKKSDGWKKAAEFLIARARPAKKRASSSRITITPGNSNRWPMPEENCLRPVAGRGGCQTGEDGNGSVLDHYCRTGPAQIFWQVSWALSAGAREGLDQRRGWKDERERREDGRCGKRRDRLEENLRAIEESRRGALFCGARRASVAARGHTNSYKYLHDLRY